MYGETETIRGATGARGRVSQESEQCHIQTQGKKTLDVLKCHPEQERYPSGHVGPSHRFREIN